MDFFLLVEKIMFNFYESDDLRDLCKEYITTEFKIY